MNMEIVIIGQNQSKYMPKMMNSTNGFVRNWVIDRCSDLSDLYLFENNEKYYKTDESLTGRQTSTCRNIGLSMTRRNSNVLFLDGDRYVTEGDLTQLDNSKYDIELLQLDEDPRSEIVYDEIYGNVQNGFYSCGIFIKRSAIKKIQDFQNGELFSQDIQNHWGIEDTYLGDVCYHLGLTCNLNQDIKLNGKFDKLELDNLDAIEARFKLRDKLNVNWN